MRILIYGVGGVGGYIGAKFIEFGYDVELCARGEHLEQIKYQGLTLIDNQKSFTFIPQDAYDRLHGQYDLVLICVKAYDLEDVAHTLQNHIHDNSVVIPVANGVGNVQKVKNILDCENIIDSCIYILSNIHKPGVINRYSEVFQLILPDCLALSRDIRAVFENSLPRVKFVNDILYHVWYKYLFISVFGSLTAFYDRPIGYIIEHKYQMAYDALLEVASLASKFGVQMSCESVKKQLLAAQKLPYDSKTSLWLDIKKGKRSEIEQLCGFIAIESKKNGMNAKIFTMVYDALATNP